MTPRVRVRVLGVGLGPQHVTSEVSEALRTVDYVLVPEAKRADDPLREARRELCRTHGDPPLVVVPDLERDDGSSSRPRYERAVSDWHEAQVAAYERVLAEHGGMAAFLAWGDASLYDASVQVVQAVAERGRLEVSLDVLPGISAPQVLAARHRIVLNDVERPVHLTTGRRLREAIAAGQENVVVMLNRVLDLTGLESWSVWWGANLGTPSESLVAGSVRDALPRITRARERLRVEAGWVMDIYLLRAPR